MPTEPADQDRPLPKPDAEPRLPEVKDVDKRMEDSQERLDENNKKNEPEAEQMTFVESLQAFFDSDTGRYAALVLVLPIADWVLGSLAAFRDGTFQLDSIAAFVRKHIAGRVIPIWMLMFLGYFTSNLTLPGVDLPVFSTFGTVLAIAYIVETIGSIMRSWGPVAPAGEPQTLLDRDPVQPRPVD